jgi:hypothetical protein
MAAFLPYLVGVSILTLVLAFVYCVAVVFPEWSRPPLPDPDESLDDPAMLVTQPIPRRVDQTCD